MLYIYYPVQTTHGLMLLLCGIHDYSDYVLFYYYYYYYFYYFYINYVTYLYIQ